MITPDASPFSRFPSRCGLALVLGVALLAPAAMAQEQAQPAQGDVVSDEVRAFCGNIIDAARDQRYLIQAKELKDLQAGVDERIAVLEQRRDEYQTWLAKRDDFLRVAEGKLTDIYKNMKPDAAAKQLEIVSPEIAAAIIMNLSPRLSSQILSEMDAKTAASLTGIIASAAAHQPPKEPS
ncbi:flagellar motility protein MotE (MotC chaperone) [Hoeflea marina]|uniref:Flagellar motility protein MotE (MotC chaperone) n=1 Tax=Hoeflea marina TaxID=274592 RepID=A0A317PGR6_9HYPH|nr:flagellar motility protein MotE (MotC chaperone) [Hoeflea marina]